MSNSIVTIRDTQLEKQRAGFIQLSLTEFTTDAEPDIAAGSVVEISGSLFEVTVDEAITGWAGMLDGAVWIMCQVDVTGTFFVAAYTNAAPIWSDELQGWYHASMEPWRYVAGLTKNGATGYEDKFYIQYGSQLQPKILGQNNAVIDFNSILLIYSEFLISSFPTPGTEIRGICIDLSTGNLISCDPTANRIYIHDGITSSILSEFPTPGTEIRGIAIDPSTGNLISSDPGIDRIHIHDGITSTISSFFASPSTNVHGVAIDPFTGNLISSDSSTNLIYIHDGITSTISSSFNSVEGSFCQLVIDPVTGDLISSYPVSSGIYIHNGITNIVIYKMSGDYSGPVQSVQGISIGHSRNLISTNSNRNLINIHAKNLIYEG